MGAFLSGGIDSTSIISIMKKHYPGDLHTFSVGFKEESYNENSDAENASKWINTIHHSYLCDLSDGLDSINTAIDAFDEPFSDTSLIPTFEVSKLASQFIKVAHSGDGADELFAGYRHYSAVRCLKFLEFWPTFLSVVLRQCGKRG